MSCNIKTYDLPPEISIVLPETNTIVTDSVIVKCLCSDDSEIDRVELWIDAEKVDSLVLRSEPFNFVLFAKDFNKNQRIALTARAYDDDDNFKDSEPVYLTMYKIDQKPSVQIIYPAEEIEVTDSIVVVCEATDDSDIQKVELLINGINNSEHVCYSEPYEFTINADDYFNTRLQLVAKAYDDAYQYSYSEPVYITINKTNEYSSLFAGQFIYTGSDEHNIYRFNFDKFILEQLTNNYSSQYPGYMDDRNKIIYRDYNENDVFTMDLDGQNQQSFYPLSLNFAGIDYCSSTNSLYFYSLENVDKIGCIDDNGFRYITEPTSYDDLDPAVNKIGNLLLFTSSRLGVKQIFLKDLSTNVEQQMTFGELKKMRAEWASNNEGFYFMEDNISKKVLKYYELEAETEITIFESENDFNYSPSYDDSHIAISIFDGNGGRLFLYTVETKKLEQIATANCILNNLKWVNPN